jgi:putative transposase
MRIGYARVSTQDQNLDLQRRGGLKVRDESGLTRVNQPLSDGDLRRLRFSVERGRPFGTEPWTRERARRLGLASTLRSRDRPRKDPS